MHNGGASQHPLSQPGVAGSAFTFGLWYICLNPLHWLLQADSWGWRTTALLGVFKLAMVISALVRTRDKMRRLLILFLLLDLGTACLLGLGRFHTGLPASVSSRYHYAALLCTLPFAALAAEWGVGILIGKHGLRRAAVSLAMVAAFGWWVARDWPIELSSYPVDRGDETRAAISRAPATGSLPEVGAIPGIPFMETRRAREIAAHFNLH